MDSQTDKLAKKIRKCYIKFTKNDSAYPKLIEVLTEYVQAVLKKSRFEHSLRVAQTASSLAHSFGVNEDKAYICGIVHDICKNMTDDEVLSLAKEDGGEILEIEKAKPSLLHGRAAAIFIKKEFGIDDTDILEAVANHTLGAPSLCPLSKIIYVADKIEPGRPQSTQEYRDRLSSMTLDEMTLAVVKENVEYLTLSGKSVAHQSFDFEASLERSIEAAASQ